GISTLSTPIPARPTTFRLVAAFSISGVTVVDERMARPSYSPMIFINSSGLSPVISSTSTPRSRKISAARGSILSDIKTFGILLFLFPVPYIRAGGELSSRNLRSILKDSVGGPPPARGHRVFLKQKARL